MLNLRKSQYLTFVSPARVLFGYLVSVIYIHDFSLLQSFMLLGYVYVYCVDINQFCELRRWVQKRFPHMNLNKVDNEIFLPSIFLEKFSRISGSAAIKI